MPFQQKNNHAAQILFPVILLLLFASFALTALLMATNVYRRTAAHAAQADEARTAVTYLAEKVRRLPAGGTISITELEGCPALELQQTRDGILYHTYIYSFGGMLHELMLRDGAIAGAEDGRQILALQQLAMETIAPGLLRFTAWGTDGAEHTAVIALRAESAGIP